MNNHFRFILVMMVLLATSYAAFAVEIDLLGLTLDVKESGIDINNVNITVEIYNSNNYPIGDIEITPVEVHHE